MSDIVPMGDRSLSNGFPEGYRAVELSTGRYGLERIENGHWIKFEDKKGSWGFTGQGTPLTNRGDIDECRKACWGYYNGKLTEDRNKRIHNPWDKVLGWYIGDHRYHAECVHHAVAYPVEITPNDGSETQFWQCEHCGEEFVSDALKHLLWAPLEYCECIICMRTNLAAEAGRSLTWLGGFRDAGFFDEAKGEGWIDETVTIEQWAKTYINPQEYLDGYKAFEDDEYPEDDLPSWMR